MEPWSNFWIRAVLSILQSALQWIALNKDKFITLKLIEYNFFRRIVLASHFLQDLCKSVFIELILYIEGQLVETLRWMTSHILMQMILDSMAPLHWDFFLASCSYLACMEICCIKTHDKVVTQKNPYRFSYVTALSHVFFFCKLNQWVFWKNGKNKSIIIS